jgi:hypothetical protein
MQIYVVHKKKGNNGLQDGRESDQLCQQWAKVVKWNKHLGTTQYISNNSFTIHIKEKNMFSIQAMKDIHSLARHLWK